MPSIEGTKSSNKLIRSKGFMLAILYVTMYDTLGQFPLPTPNSKN